MSDSQPQLSNAFIQQLKAALATDQIALDEATRWSYGYDNSKRQSKADVVVFPASHADVEAIVLLCCEHHVRVYARGRGTGTTGAAIPLEGGLVMSMERMTRVIRMDADNRFIEVECGITNGEVQRVAGEQGFFWPPDPTSAQFCSIGGNLGFNSAGPRAVKYGTPRENTLGLKFVTGKGESMSTGVYTTKGVVGYDLTRLIVGSEGTLGVITEATLKLTPLPETKRTIRVIYDSMTGAAQAVSAVMAQPMVPCALEFMDEEAVQLVRQHAVKDIPETAKALLMIEVDGAQDSISLAVDAVVAAADNQHLLDVVIADDEQQIKTLWEARKALSPLLRGLAPKKINEDVVVPVSRMPDLITGLQDISNRFGILIANFGHAGNGNIHTNMLYDPADPKQASNAQPCLEAVFDLVLRLEGTLSGEHGVGLEKRDYIAQEIDPVSLRLMREIKQCFDPENIMNPDKMLPLL